MKLYFLFCYKKRKNCNIEGYVTERVKLAIVMTFACCFIQSFSFINKTILKRRSSRSPAVVNSIHIDKATYSILSLNSLVN